MEKSKNVVAYRRYRQRIFMLCTGGSFWMIRERYKKGCEFGEKGIQIAGLGNTGGN